MAAIKAFKAQVCEDIADLTADEFEEKISFYWCETQKTITDDGGKEILIVDPSVVPMSAQECLEDWLNRFLSDPGATANPELLRRFMTPEEWWGSSPSELLHEWEQGVEIESIIANENTTKDGYPVVKTRQAIAWLESLVEQGDWRSI